jgi:hypothetical protein
MAACDGNGEWCCRVGYDSWEASGAGGIGVGGKTIRRCYSCGNSLKSRIREGAHMAQQPSHETVSILREFDLGQHTLFLMSDGSMDLLANDEHTPSFAENLVSLDAEETYRLFIALHEQFQRKQV